MSAQAKVEQRHRVDYTVSDSHEASALLSALRNMHCDRPHSIFGPPCERCLSTVHDALAKAICVIRTDAEQRGREAERETITKALKWAESLGICYENLVEGLYDEAVAKD